MRIFVRIERYAVAQVVVLPDGVVPSHLYVPSIAATFVDTTDKDPAPQITWLFYEDGGFGPPAPLTPDLLPDEARARAKDLLYSSDPVIEHFYELRAPVPAEWAEYRRALRVIAVSGIVAAEGAPERPDLPLFGFRRDGRVLGPRPGSNALAA